MGDEKNILNNLEQELRRGTLILSVLSQLDEKHYGYSLVQRLEEKGVPIDPNTLYPLLRRLEKQGLLTSEWDVGESKPRKYYCRTRQGDEIYSALKKQWEELSSNMKRLFEKEQGNESE